MQTAEVETVAPTSVHFGRQYPASKASCPRARHDVAAVLTEIGLTDEGAYAGSVVFSELFTNAVLHHPVEHAECVHIGIHGAQDGQRWVGIAVTDSGRGSVRPGGRVAAGREDFGRGLDVVRGLGARLTDVRLPGAYTVTAWVPALDMVRRRVCRCDCASIHGAEPSACSWLIEDWDALDEVRRQDDPAAYLCLNCRKLVEQAVAADQAPARTNQVVR